MTHEVSVQRRPVTRVTGRSRESFEDALAVERPLQIRVAGSDVAVTLRTPGHDRELVLGFLAAEQVIARAEDVLTLASRMSDCADAPDLAEVELAPGVTLDWTRLERHFAATAACGLCGRAHLDALRTGLARVAEGPTLDVEALLALPARVRTDQAAFEATGGLHAAVWCDASLAPLQVIAGGPALFTDDADLPANTLSFSLDAGAPAGATITPAGAFSWTPTEAQGPGVYSITVRVTDNGTPPLARYSRTVGCANFPWRILGGPGKMADCC